MVPFYFFTLECQLYRSSGHAHIFGSGAAMYLIFIDSVRSQHEPRCSQSTRMNAQCVILCCWASLNQNNNKSWSLTLGRSIGSWRFLSEQAGQSANLSPHSLMSYPRIKRWLCWKHLGSCINRIYEIDQAVFEILYKYTHMHLKFLYLCSLYSLYSFKIEDLKEQNVVLEEKLKLKIRKCTILMIR